MNLHWIRIDWLQSYQQGGKVFEIQKYIFGFFFSFYNSLPSGKIFNLFY